jgi:YD repeat-containing protein
LDFNRTNGELESKMTNPTDKRPRRLRETTEYRFVSVREPRGHKLLFKYEPQHNLIEIVQRGQRFIVDLAEYQGGQVSPLIVGKVDVT